MNEFEKTQKTIEWWKNGELHKTLSAITKCCGKNIKKTGFATCSYFTMADCCLLAYISKTSKNVVLEKGLTEITAMFPWIDVYWNKHCKGKLKEWFSDRRKSYL